MKATQNIDRPILSGPASKDERDENVFLLRGNEKEKVTAHDIVGYWQIVEWEAYTKDEVVCWLSRNAWYVEKEVVRALCAVQEMQKIGTTGLDRSVKRGREEIKGESCL